MSLIPSPEDLNRFDWHPYESSHTNSYSCYGCSTPIDSSDTAFYQPDPTEEFSHYFATFPIRNHRFPYCTRCVGQKIESRKQALQTRIEPQNRSPNHDEVQWKMDPDEARRSFDSLFEKHEPYQELLKTQVDSSSLASWEQQIKTGIEEWKSNELNESIDVVYKCLLKQSIQFTTDVIGHLQPNHRSQSISVSEYFLQFLHLLPGLGTFVITVCDLAQNTGKGAFSLKRAVLDKPALREATTQQAEKIKETLQKLGARQ